MTQREVIFTLKPELAEGAAAEFNRFASMAEKANQRIASATKTASERAAAEWQKVYDRLGMRAAAAYTKQTAAAEKAAKEQARAAERAAREQERAQERAARAAEKAARDAEREAQRREKAEIARELRVFRAKQKAIEERQKAEERAAREAERLRERERKEEERALSRAEQADERRRQSALIMKESALEAAQGALLAAKGFAELGILGEETAEGLLRAFIRVQAAYDILEGGFRVYKKLTEAADAYRHSVEAATVAERALAGARVAGGAAAGVSVAGGAAGAAAGVSVAGGAAGAATGTAGAAGAGAAGLGAAAASIAAFTSGLAAATLAALEWGEVAIRTARGEDPYGGRITQATGRAARWWATSGWSGTSLTPDHEANLRAAEQGRMGWLPFTRSYYQAEAGAIRAERTTERMTAERQQMLEMAAASRERERAVQAARLELAAIERARAEHQVETEVRGEGLTGTAAEAEVARRLQEMHLKDITTAKARVEGLAGVQPRSMAEAARLEEQQRAARGALASAESQAIEATRERLELEKRISAERLQAAEAAISKTREEITLREQLIEQEQQRLMTAQERIASMSEAEQAAFAERVRAVRQKIEGGETLTAGEFRFVQQWSGLREFETIKREQAERRAAPLMAELGLGREERERMESLQREREQLEVRLKDERQYRVVLESDTDRIVSSLYQQLRQLQDEQAERIAAQLRAEWQRDLERVTAGIRRDTDGRTNAINRALGK